MFPVLSDVLSPKCSFYMGDILLTWFGLLISVGRVIVNQNKVVLTDHLSSTIKQIYPDWRRLFQAAAPHPQGIKAYQIM